MNQKRMSSRRLLPVGILMELCYLVFYLTKEGPGEVLLFICINVATYLLLAFLVWQMRSAPSGSKAGSQPMVIVLAFGLLFRLTLVPHPVVCSDDIFRYLWDGRVAASGVNPFLYSPTDPHLSHLVTADLPAKINHPEMRSVYPAVAQAFFYLSNRLFGESPAGFKFLLVCIDCVTMLLLWYLLRRRGESVLLLLVYAWSPLPVMYFGLDGHIDALGIPFLILSLVYFASKRPLRAVVALGLSILTKLVSLLVVPLLWRLEKGFRRFLLIGVPLLIVALGYWMYLEPSGGILESLKTFGTHWEFNGSIFSLVFFLTSSNEIAHQVAGIIMIAWFGSLAVLNRPLIEKIFWGFVGFMLLSPVVHPWYLTWLAALLVVRWSTAVFVFLGLSSIANVVVYQYRAFGEWKDQPLLLILEYLPVAILLAREIMRKDVLRIGEENATAPGEAPARIPGSHPAR